jgi:sugar lactone lactonase YvrE
MVTSIAMVTAAFLLSDASAASSAVLPPVNLYVLSGPTSPLVKIPAGSGPILRSPDGKEPAPDSIPVTGVGRALFLAVDSAGDLFLSDEGNKLVTEVPAGGGPQITLASGLSEPEGIAVDESGNVYVADAANELLKLPATGGKPIVFATGMQRPTGVAVDGSGDVFVSVINAQQEEEVVELSPRGAVKRTVDTHHQGLLGGLAVDPSGNIYVGSNYYPWVLKIALNGTTTEIGTGLMYPFGVATDAAGDLFIADVGNQQIDEIPAGGGPQVVVQNYINLVAIAAQANPPSGSAETPAVGLGTPEVPWVPVLPVLAGAIFLIAARRLRSRRPGSSDS